MIVCKVGQLLPDGTCNRFGIECFGDNGGCRFFHKVTNFEDVTKSLESLASFIVEVSEDCHHECSSKCISCDKPWCSYEKTLAWLKNQVGQ